jgi:hypothetical protein
MEETLSFRPSPEGNGRTGTIDLRFAIDYFSLEPPPALASGTFDLNERKATLELRYCPAPSVALTIDEPAPGAWEMRGRSDVVSVELRISQNRRPSPEPLSVIVQKPTGRANLLCF